MPSVLIVEDDLMIADMLEEVLLDSGYAVCGIARTVAAAVALAHLHRPDFAVVDMRLADGGTGTEVRALLKPTWPMGILYATGNRSKHLLSSTDGHACLTKPYRSDDLLRGLEIVAGIMMTGHAEQPFPAGFSVLVPAQAP